MDCFERIGLVRPQEPTFATLAAVVAHVRAIPFENEERLWVSSLEADLPIDFDMATTRQIADRAELQRLLANVFASDCDVSRLRVPTIPEWD